MARKKHQLRRTFFTFLFMIIVSLLSGCLYPQEKRVENQVPYETQILSVQTAVEAFQKDKGGILPIKTKENDTSIYIKYVIDFQKLVPAYLPDYPGNAYENGGPFQYVLIDVETEPKVKLLDLRITEEIRELRLRLHTQGYPPFKEQVANNVYTLDYSRLGYEEEPYVVSPYTNHHLPLLITGSGEVQVDYSSDLYLTLQEKNHSYQPGDDIRPILTDDSFFVPAYSLPYTIDEKNEPVFMTK